MPEGICHRIAAVPLLALTGLHLLLSSFLLGYYQHLDFWTRLALFIAIGACSYAISDRIDESSSPRERRLVWATIIAIVMVAVAFPFRGSNDLWSYHTYGRLFAIHHLSPYTHTPADIPGDFAAGHVNDVWRNTTSVYGPSFIWIAGAIAKVAGTSELAMRLGHQLLAALSWGLALFVVRNTTALSRIALIALCPPVWLVINSGHNDLLVGVALLLAALALTRRWWMVAAGLAAFAATIKATAGIAVFGMAVWILRRHGWKPCLGFTSTAAGAVILVGAPFGTSVTSALSSNSVIVGGPTPWRPVLAVLYPIASACGIEHHDVTTVVARIALMITIGVMVAVVVRPANTHHDLTLRSTAVYQATALWIMPWYWGWALPSLLGSPRSAITDWSMLHMMWITALALAPKSEHVTMTSAVVVGVSYVGSVLALWRLRRSFHADSLTTNGVSYDSSN